jgi:hypothetical protein
MVTPERDVPGISASACATPIAIACGQPRPYSLPVPRLRRSAAYINTPNTVSVPAMKSGWRKCSSM